MRNCSKEKGCEEKAKAKEEEEGGLRMNLPKNKGATSNYREWSGFRNPRIVRVSRSFGGKDRHSKVCTIRGLRDRRIRLSIPTAIQLYDLQHKLKLGQPSKVIDWLLDVTKLDIDKLPPLQIPTGFISPSSSFHQHMLFPTQHDHTLIPPPFALDIKPDSSSTSTTHIRSNDVVNQAAAATTTTTTKQLWDMDHLAEMRATLLQENKASSSTTKGKWIHGISSSTNTNQQMEDYYNQQQISPQKLFSIPNSSNDDHQPSSSLSLSQFGSNSNSNNNNNEVLFPSPLVEAQTSTSISSSSSSPLFFTPFASYITNPFESHIHFLSSNSQYAFSNNNNNNNNNTFIPNSALHPFASHNLKPFPPPNFNLKQLLHPDNDNNDDDNNPDSGKDGASR